MSGLPLIQLATDDDLAAIAAISNRAAETGTANFATEAEPEEQWRASFAATRASHPWLVARDEGRVVGFAKAGPHRARGAYRFTAELSVYLDDAWRGRGAGRELYAALLPMLRAQGYVTLLAGITAGHEASERLHARVGFTRCGTFHRVGWKHGAWHDVGYWELPLAAAGAPRPVRAVDEVPFVRRAPRGGPVAAELIGELDAELSAIYPEEDATHFRLDADEVAPGRGAFVVADLGGEAVGCGAIRAIGDGRVEVKRMYVRASVRGRGVSAAILDALELHARLLAAREVVLETGTRQHAAIQLYERRGYAIIPPWGAYVGSPVSVCYGKRL